MAGQNGTAGIPVKGFQIQERLGFLSNFRQYRCQISNQLAEQVQCHRTDFLNLLLTAFFFIHRPGRFFLDVLIGTVGQRHDLFHGTTKFAGFVKGCDLFAGINKLLHHFWLSAGSTQFTAGFGNKIAGA